MRYYFPHPVEAEVYFEYDPEQPQFIVEHQGTKSHKRLLQHERINLEEFLYLLLVTKTIYLKNREQGVGDHDGKTFLISRPYDCKWALLKFLRIPTKNPLLISVRGDGRYLWTLSDDEMRFPPVVTPSAEPEAPEPTPHIPESEPEPPKSEFPQESQQESSQNTQQSAQETASEAPQSFADRQKQFAARFTAEREQFHARQTEMRQKIHDWSEPDTSAAEEATSSLHSEWEATSSAHAEKTEQAKHHFHDLHSSLEEFPEADIRTRLQEKARAFRERQAAQKEQP